MPLGPNTFPSCFCLKHPAFKWLGRTEVPEPEDGTGACGRPPRRPGGDRKRRATRWPPVFFLPRTVPLLPDRQRQAGPARTPSSSAPRPPQTGACRASCPPVPTGLPTCPPAAPKPASVMRLRGTAPTPPTTCHFLSGLNSEQTDFPASLTSRSLTWSPREAPGKESVFGSRASSRWPLSPLQRPPPPPPRVRGGLKEAAPLGGAVEKGHHRHAAQVCSGRRPQSLGFTAAR